MLRNRSRAVTSKQSLMADHSSQSSSPIHNHRNPIPSFFVSPRFKAFTTKYLAADQTHEVMISPTSTLDTKPIFSSFVNPFWSEFSSPKSPKLLSETKPFSREKLDSKGIGLALVDILTDHHHHHHKTIEQKSSSSSYKPSNKMVVFGTKLRVQIPVPPCKVSSTQSPESPADFGIKTRNIITQFSPTGSANAGTQRKESPTVVTGCLSASEMELSEDYTCVISHGPKPKTTHIFDNCIVESYCASLSDKLNSAAPENFLSCCYTCKKNLEQKNDIYIYRGEKAFCSQECRYQEMLIDGLEN